MSLLVKKAGLLATVQDAGRFGYRHLGINPNGPMDRAAARIAATLCGDETETVLELHFPAGEFQFLAPTSFVLTGADFGPCLDGRPIGVWQVNHAGPGATLSFRERLAGQRCYLAVSTGFAIEEWLGSRSTNLRAGAGGFDGRALRTGDLIQFKDSRVAQIPAKLAAGRVIRPPYNRFPNISIVAGAEYSQLTRASVKILGEERFIVDRSSDRMGFRLRGPAISREFGGEIVSTAVNAGTIQLLPDGQLVILMADHQTVGGYPRIGHVVPTDLPLVAQLGPGDDLGFRLVSLAAAEQAALNWERDLKLLEAAVALAAVPEARNEN